MQHRQRLEALLNDMNRVAPDVETFVLGVFANDFALKAAGYVELSTASILTEYGRQHGNRQIVTFVQRSIARNNSLNCEKIQFILNTFDNTWWPAVESRTNQSVREAIDSLKTLRDQLAHGRQNGTGLSVVSGYFREATAYVDALADVVLR